MQKLTIGSDPEFNLSTPFENKPICASSHIQDPDRKKPFGLDGNSNLVELRPKPSTSPLVHASNIEKIFKDYLKSDLFKKINGFNFTTVCLHDSFSVGGHIHFGHDYLIENSFDRKREKISSLVNNLDFLLSFPLMYIEPERSGNTRKKISGYGHLRDYRPQNWGIEYRTPPSWISTKMITKAVLCLAYAIARETLDSDFDTNNEIEGFALAYNSNFKKLIKPFLPEAEKIIKKLSLYKHYKIYIDYLLKCSKNEKLILEKDIKEGWFLPYKNLKGIILLTAEQLVSKLTQIMPQKVNQNSVGFTFFTHKSKNFDFKVKEIALNLNCALCAIILPTVIKLINNKQIYIYGLKKERKEVILIQINPNYALNYKKRIRLYRLLQEILTLFKYTTPIYIEIRTYYDVGNFIAKVGLGFNIRSTANFLSEALLTTILLFLNNSFYKHDKINKKTGKTTLLPLRRMMFLKAYKEFLLKLKKTPNTSSFYATYTSFNTSTLSSGSI